MKSKPIKERCQLCLSFHNKGRGWRKKTACQALHNAVQITGPLECTNAPRTQAYAMQFGVKLSGEPSVPSFLSYFSACSADPLSLDREDYHEGKVWHVTERGQMVTDVALPLSER